jgi:hypothetical protein
MTQEMQVLKHIKRYGKITSMKAFEKYGITRLAARIYTLRTKGYGLTPRQLAMVRQDMLLTQWTSLF